MYGISSEKDYEDQEKASNILKKALEIKGLEDKEDVQDRLEIYE